MPFYVGLDLGQAADYTALAVVQDGKKRNPPSGKLEKFLHLRHLERYPLRTLYPDIAEGVAALMGAPELSPDEFDGVRIKRTRHELVVDQTGVGPAVTDLLKKRGVRFRAVTITGGNQITYGGGSWHVPKRDLVGALEVAFHTGELQAAEDMELWPELKKELLNFQIVACNGERRGVVSPYKIKQAKEATVVNKVNIALWALRNPRTRGLIIKGLKNRRVRGLAWAVTKRRIRR